MRGVRGRIWATLRLLSELVRALSNLAHVWGKLWCTEGDLAPTFVIGHVGTLLGPLTCSLYGGEYMLKGGRGAWVTVFLCVGECHLYKLFC